MRNFVGYLKTISGLAVTWNVHGLMFLAPKMCLVRDKRIKGDNHFKLLLENSLCWHHVCICKVCVSIFLRKLCGSWIPSMETTIKSTTYAVRIRLGILLL